MERDINLAKSGKQDLIYKTLIGLKADLSKPAETPEILVNKLKTDSNCVEEENDICSSSFEHSDVSDRENESEIENMDNIKSKFVNSARYRNESPESKKVRYKQIYFISISYESLRRQNMYKM